MAGISRPVAGAAEAEVGQGKKRTKVKTHGKDGQRARYFPDDDQHSLKNMVRTRRGEVRELVKGDEERREERRQWWR